MENKQRSAVFLDRDGTINVEKNYLIDPQEFVFVPGAPEAIRALKQAGYLVVVVTNQSGIARGYFSVEQVEHLHAHMQHMLQEYSTQVDAFYVCPHHPSAGDGPYTCECTCRKGEPGMLFAAARALNIDLTTSYIVGDKVADLDAGFAAGCSPILVRTGYGDKTLQTPTVQKWQEAGRIAVCADLPTAVQHILAQPSRMHGQVR
ncbi:MAG: D-glycero-beta-D-manno-heptose 1,7-bisphosphate 7-phosphatase [Desulfuromonadaceae bacterium]|nr:D-glycero-beta-D-manno-heptose 1,7-bisphosphate 7-phosphatase [Desulfuromonadaceae bacterium]